MLTAERIREADDYLAARTGRYDLRCHRYDAALEAMHNIGLTDACTVVDVGSGWSEFGIRMFQGHDELGVHARYIPVDACNDGFRVQEASFYGQSDDSLLGVWTPV